MVGHLIAVMRSDEIEVQHFARGKPVLVLWHAIIRARRERYGDEKKLFPFTSGYVTLRFLINARTPI